MKSTKSNQAAKEAGTRGEGRRKRLLRVICLLFVGIFLASAFTGILLQILYAA